MAKTTPGGNKHKKHRMKASIDSKRFRPGNPQARVRRLEQAAEKRYYRTAAKAAKRRWDLPRKKTTPPPSVASAPSVNVFTPTTHASGDLVDLDPVNFKDPRAQSDSGMAEEPPFLMDSSDINAAVGTAASPTSEEAMAIHALAQLAEGVASHVLQDFGAGKNFQQLEIEFEEVHVNENAMDDWRAGSVDSAFEKANLKLDYKNGSIPLDVRRGDLPPALSPLTRVQQASLEITGDIGLLTAVQAAQLKVAQLCNGDSFPVTPEDAVNYRAAGTLITDRWDASDWTKKEVATNRWRRNVSRAVGKARLTCEKDEGVWGLDLEEEDGMTIW
ncbi:hypothetical protein C8R43DRAFT_943509 [Mycena crocata]|nr:hypothetical protein C8R43DRAFT_943509 [Mycena crocata]